MVRKLFMWTEKILSGHKFFYTDTFNSIRSDISLYGHKQDKPLQRGAYHFKFHSLVRGYCLQCL